MAKTSFLDIDPALIDQYYSNLKPGDRYINPRIIPKDVILSRQKIEGLTLRSYLPHCAELWNAMDDAEQANWKSVSPYEYPNGWCVFVSDQCKRIKYGISGTATPITYHQSNVGKIKIEAPASEIKLIQPHPHKYYVKRLKTGKDAMFVPVEVTEDLALPLQISINYKSALTATNGSPKAQFYAEIRHEYQGEGLDHQEIIDIPLSSAWDYKESTCSNLIGQPKKYDLYLHLQNVTGTLLFDNLEAYHSAQNWVRDPTCQEIDESFARSFYQVPEHWAPVTLPDGADYQSVYPTGLEASIYGVRIYADFNYGKES